jgi:hypothetical protein
MDLRRIAEGAKRANGPWPAFIVAAVRRPRFVLDPPIERFTCDVVGWVGETSRLPNDRRPNGVDVKPRGQGPRAEADAAHGLPAFESRDAGRAPPCLILILRGGSAAGPKPGRLGFYVELDGATSCAVGVCYCRTGAGTNKRWVHEPSKQL